MYIVINNSQNSNSMFVFKSLLILCIILNLQLAFSQYVEVKGNVKTNKNVPVLIVLNDTINKLQKLSAQDLPSKIWDNEAIVKYPDDSGSFKFKAQLKDSLFFSYYDHIPQKFAVADLLAQKEINIILKPLDCIYYEPCIDKNPEKFIFIGRKIEVVADSDPKHCNMISMDSKSKATYKIIKNLSSTKLSDTNEFFSYDHFSMIKYDDYENVVLFVKKYCGRLIQQKYQYYPVYKTKDGNWAIPVVKDFDTSIKVSSKEPRKVKMAEPITIVFRQTYRKLEEQFPKPYFEIKDGKVYMLYGYYPEDLVTVKD